MLYYYYQIYLKYVENKMTTKKIIKKIWITLTLTCFILPISYAEEIHTLSEREILGIAAICYDDTPMEKFPNSQEEKNLMPNGLEDIQTLKNFLTLK